MRFWNTCVSSSRSPTTKSGSPGAISIGDLVRLRERGQGARSTFDDGDDIDNARGRIVLVQLDPGEREQIVDQAAHARGLDVHDLEEAVARLGVVPRVAPQRVDEAGDRGQRCAQFVAGIGDEIGPQLLGPPDRREVVDLDQDAPPAFAAARPHDGGAEMPLQRHGMLNVTVSASTPASIRSTASSSSGVRSTAEMCLRSASAPTKARPRGWQRRCARGIEQQQWVIQALEDGARRLGQACAIHRLGCAGTLRPLQGRRRIKSEPETEEDRHERDEERMSAQRGKSQDRKSPRPGGDEHRARPSFGSGPAQRNHDHLEERVWPYITSRPMRSRYQTALS